MRVIFPIHTAGLSAGVAFGALRSSDVLFLVDGVRVIEVPVAPRSTLFERLHSIRESSERAMA